MQKRQVIGAQGVTVPAGVAMKLSADQHRRRQGVLEAIDASGKAVTLKTDGKGRPEIPAGQVFRTTAPTQFKYGEVVEIDDVKGLVHKDALGDVVVTKVATPSSKEFASPETAKTGKPRRSARAKA